MNVLVTGGTGALGRDLVVALRSAGHRVRVMSRRSGTGTDWVQGDLATGKGLDAALADMEAVVHAASAAAQPWRLRATDVHGTRRLLEAAKRAHVKHVVYISIVGMEGIAYPYYRAKLAAEAIVAEGIVPWSILRATQFHTLMEIFLGAFSRLPRLCAVPFAWQFQPVDTRDVAARLVNVTAGSAAGRLPDFGGPEVRTFRSLAESWLKARHLDKKLVNVPMPLKFSRQVAAGKLLAPDQMEGKTTFEQYLVRRYGRW
ncbi:MAG TPA: NAD(P)H-binding protein [Candidatus Dormibacteraeota bacterium]|nr:NAD(P)H-binding protein [Candidatus Dormibacteraeota bacterium]